MDLIIYIWGWYVGIRSTIQYNTKRYFIRWKCIFVNSIVSRIYIFFFIQVFTTYCLLMFVYLLCSEQGSERVLCVCVYVMKKLPMVMFDCGWWKNALLLICCKNLFILFYHAMVNIFIFISIEFYILWRNFFYVTKIHWIWGLYMELSYELI